MITHIYTKNNIVFCFSLNNAKCIITFIFTAYIIVVKIVKKW